MVIARGENDHLIIFNNGDRQVLTIQIIQWIGIVDQHVHVNTYFCFSIPKGYFNHFLQLFLVILIHIIHYKMTQAVNFCTRIFFTLPCINKVVIF